MADSQQLLEKKSLLNKRWWGNWMSPQRKKLSLKWIKDINLLLETLKPTTGKRK